MRPSCNSTKSGFTKTIWSAPAEERASKPLAHHLRVAPRASAVLAAPHEGVPAEVVVHEGHQQRSVRERLDAGVVELLLGVALVLDGYGGHLLKRTAVPRYAYVALCCRRAAPVPNNLPRRAP